jgi:outer membrane protein assembly factor BamB
MMVMKRLLSAGSLLFLAICLYAQNWPSFRGPGATGLADGQNPPISWDAEQSVNILWETDIPGLSHSSPVVWGDRVFITTAVSGDKNPEFRRAFALEGPAAGESSDDMSKQSWRIYCLDKSSGKVLWEKTAHEGVPKVKRHPKNSHASQTPATNGKYVVASFGPEGLYCYDFQGNLRWSQDLADWDFMGSGRGAGSITFWGVSSSPIIYKNLAIIQCDSHKNSLIAAFDLETGQKIWSTPRQATSSWSTPTVYEGKTRAELITNGTDHIRAYDPMTGKELWRLKGTTNISTPTPFVAGDLIFCDSGFHSKGPIFVIRPGGEGDITPPQGESSAKYVAWSVQTGASENPTPIAYGDYLYVVSNNGILTCYKAKTGEIVYRERIGGRGGAFSASPVAADGRVYLTSEDGDIYVIKAGPAYELLATNPMGEVCMATPAISHGMLIIRTQHHLYAVGGK